VLSSSNVISLLAGPVGIIRVVGLFQPCPVCQKYWVGTRRFPLQQINRIALLIEFDRGIACPLWVIRVVLGALAECPLFRQ
jgi:hypothetical protein